MRSRVAVAAAARVRGAVAAIAALAIGRAIGVALGVAIGVAGCGGDSARDGARGERVRALYEGAAADVVVLASSASGRDGKVGGVRTTIDWLNFATRGVGPARVLDAGTAGAALADSLALARVLIVPRSAARDARLAAACGAAVDSGLVAVVDLGAPPDEKARAAWRAASKRADSNIVFVERPVSDAAVWDEILAIAPLPHLAPAPAGYPRIALPVVAAMRAELVRLESMPRREHLLFTACVFDSTVTIEDLEAARRARAAIGAAFAPALAGAAPSAADWRAFDATREAMRRMGASEAERACAFAPRALDAAAQTRLAGAGVRLLAIGRGGADPDPDAGGDVFGAAPADGAFDALPYQAAGDAGESLPLLVVPCHDATALAPEPGRLFDAMSSALDDSIWVTSVETYSRFWEARARTSLTSAWRDQRLQIRLTTPIDHLVVAIPRAAGGAVLAEILVDGASIVPDPDDADAFFRLPLTRGEKTVWGVYR